MTRLSFPPNPTEGRRYAAPNGIQYVFDGVKWIVETTNPTSETISNSVQDRVAPMLVNSGNDNINFTYNDVNNTLDITINVDGGTASTSF